MQLYASTEKELGLLPSSLLLKLTSKKKGETESKNGNGEAVASAFVGQFYPLQGLFHQKNWTTTAVGIQS
ncbi:hypothetical protein [Paenibacillus sp. IITD108]|uniref:hypothetical protein n=1 Tax=Paenibacillus sp. IITD108 TaxID=3116649 RepID=UPI002F415545